MLNRYHPIASFLYFMCVIFLTMFTMNPIILGISLLSSILLAYMVEQRKPFIISLFIFLLIFIIIAFSNPLFSQNGNTILFYLGKLKVTKEAIYYGLAVASMLIAILLWFKSYNIIINSDKFIYLFGKFAPSITLIISMGLKYIPNFQKQMIKINEAQKCLGVYSNKGIINKIKNQLRILLALISWSLENAMDTSDAMKAKGYGIIKRTNYSIFPFRKNDGIFLVFDFIFIGVIIIAKIVNIIDFNYYPMVNNFNFTPINILCYFGFGILMLLPFILEVKEKIKWHYLQSKI